ncbi:MAG: helix-turn-helix transcriptional regulator, partial [Alphaproteobacteria bacterium]|nr:helix-turn-helix transcriptional regulator [Alphaproteobacteria bacterium]
MIKKISNAEKMDEIMQNESRFVVSRNVKFYRKKRRLTQFQLALKIGKTVEMVCQIENNVAGTKLATLDAIANALDIATKKSKETKIMEQKIKILIADESEKFRKDAREYLSRY